MKTRSGQAGRIILEAVHQLGRIVLRLLLLVLAALGLFAYSLSRHPIELPHLASWLATNASGDGISVHTDQAELAWSGYAQGASDPFVLRLDAVDVHSAAGALLLHIPRADLTVPPVDLFGGREAILLHAEAARLSGSQAPVSISAKLWPGPSYSLARGEFFVTIGPGTLSYGGAGVPLAAASFLVRTSPGAVDVTQGQATLAHIGGSAPHVSFGFSARRGENWTGNLQASLDIVRAEELGQYWPVPALTNTRAWVVKHITAGSAANAAFTFSLSAPGDLSELDLDNVTGHFTGQDLTLYWLAGAVPITGLDGIFTMPDIDEAVISASAGQIGQVAIRPSGMDITGLNHDEQTGALRLSLAGGLPDVLAILAAPPLDLLRTAPPELASATGQAEGVVTASIPFLEDVTFAQLKLGVTARVHDMAMPSLLPPLGARHGEVWLQTDGHGLHLQAHAEFAGEPASLALDDKFAGAGRENIILTGAAGPDIWHWLGADSATALAGPAGGVAPFTIHVTGTATGAQTALLQADLTPASLALPGFGWDKETGVKGGFSLTAQLHGNDAASVQNFAVQAPGLDVAGTRQNGMWRLSALDIGRTQATGTLIPPASPGASWAIDLSGPVLDIRRAKSSGAPATAPKSAPVVAVQKPVPPPSGPLWSARLNFGQLYLAPAPAPSLGQFTLIASGRGATPLAAQGAADGLDFNITPQNATNRILLLHSQDTGTLLRALGTYAHLQGGTLTLTSSYGAGAPAKGLATLRDARFVNAPDVTKFLQALTLYGLADAASGPGLKISRAEIPFTLQDGILVLHQARAFSSSLGFTASGTLDLADSDCDLDTTIVPLYALNALPGKIPFIGRLFSAEKGGGLLAIRAHITGPFGDAQVRINPLSALAPGFLRGIFGIGEENNSTKD